MAKTEPAFPVRGIDDPLVTVTLSEREVREIAAMYSHVVPTPKVVWFGVEKAICEALDDDLWFDQHSYDWENVSFLVDEEGIEVEVEVDRVEIEEIN